MPWQTAYASTQLIGGDVTFVLGGSGHIAGVINPPAKKKRNHWIGAVKADAGDWLAAASDVPGSWWPLGSNGCSRMQAPCCRPQVARQPQAQADRARAGELCEGEGTVIPFSTDLTTPRRTP